jgi:hypothetical protein
MIVNGFSKTMAHYRSVPCVELISNSDDDPKKPLRKYDRRVFHVIWACVVRILAEERSELYGPLTHPVPQPNTSTAIPSGRSFPLKTTLLREERLLKAPLQSVDRGRSHLRKDPSVARKAVLA